MPEQTILATQKQHYWEPAHENSSGYCNDMVALQAILVGVAKTVCNPYTIDPLRKLGLTKDKALKLPPNSIIVMSRQKLTVSTIQSSSLSKGHRGGRKLWDRPKNNSLPWAATSITITSASRKDQTVSTDTNDESLQLSQAMSNQAHVGPACCWPSVHVCALLSCKRDELLATHKATQ